MAVHITGRRPTIPEYYEEYINNKVNLLDAPKQCCPFHQEDTPSFSYSAEKGRWRCFGGCKTGGDVVDLHRKNYNLSSRKEAEESLDALYGVVRRKKVELVDEMVMIDDEKVENEEMYQRAILMATTIERQMDLIYVMSKTPVDYLEITQLVYSWEDEDDDITFSKN